MEGGLRFLGGREWKEVWLGNCLFPALLRFLATSYCYGCEMEGKGHCGHLEANVPEALAFGPSRGPNLEKWL